jgi:light-regulated signal transduction histidine kinase (bacteriophytochrome)
MNSSFNSCDLEPIHTLGLIQGHGALLAFDESGRLIAQSKTASHLLGSLPPFGGLICTHHLDIASRTALARTISEPGVPTQSVPCTGADQQPMDLVMHWSEGLLLAEWEQTTVDAQSAGHYAELLRRAIQGLQSSTGSSISGLLQAATSAIRAFTGFDRVMAYRFLPDDSGQVEAESTRKGVPPYLGLRFPAGDIPKQARLLYTQNLVRYVADTGAVPVPIRTASDLTPPRVLDLSYSILRSVSPTHVIYLTNMGVAASMSVSIVVNGKLWGLIACHHMTPLQPSHSVRVSSTVFAQVLAVMIERFELSAHTAAERQIDALRTQIADALVTGRDTMAALIDASSSMRALIGSNGLSVVVGQRVSSFPLDVNRKAALKVAEFMTHAHKEMFLTDSIQRDAPAVGLTPEETANAAGFLAIQAVADEVITLIWWRIEVVETVNWAGARDLSPDGAPSHSLRPRTSFASWNQEVHGHAEGWSYADHYAARELKSALRELALNQMLAIKEEEASLLGIMGHDLRDPLQAIDMAVTLIGLGRLSADDGARRIAYSSHRMQSLISYILDVSRLRTGVGLNLNRQAVALQPVLVDTLDQAAQAYPGVMMTSTVDVLGEVMLDRDRFVQAISNLLSNARQHGDMRFPISVDAYCRENFLVIEIRNRITPEQRFVPGPMTSQLKQSVAANQKNRQGLGLGLYIANAIVTGHGGTLDAECYALDVVFRVSLPTYAAAKQECMVLDGSDAVTQESAGAVSLNILTEPSQSASC